MIIRFEQKDKYNPDDVLKRLSDTRIYEHYFNESIRPNTAYNCCFHKDTTPSLHFKRMPSGLLIYNCFGCGAKGNVFNFVKDLQQISYGDAIKEVVDTLEGNTTKKYTKDDFEDQFFSQRNITEIYPYFRKMSDSDLSYWNNFHISLKTLNKFNVNVCDRVFIFGKKNPLELKYISSNPIFSYTFRRDGFKIYRPLNPTKMGKFFGNVNEFDVQGLAQLPKNGETLIITSSLKDVMVLDELGYNAIAPQGEGIDIPDKIMDFLIASFTNIYILYDTDEAGFKYANKLGNKYNLKTIFIDEKYKTKDISDFIRKYGIDNTIELLHKLVNG